MSQILERLRPLITTINQEIVKGLGTDDPLLAEVAGHILTAGGKRLRPLFFVLSGRLAEGPEEELLRLSPAFELLHAASLLHDDLVDQALTRRGRPAAHALFGPAEAVLTGDYLMAKAADLAVSSGNLACMAEVARILRLMSEGELLQRQNRRNTALPLETYFKIIYRKTAALLEGASYLGALTAKADPARTRALRIFGRKLGLAFQIVDDCLDYEGQTSELGKPVGHDLDEGQITLPLILARARAEAGDRKRLDELAGRAGRRPEELNELLAIISRYEGVARARLKSDELIAEALGELELFPASEIKDALVGLGSYVVERHC